MSDNKLNFNRPLLSVRRVSSTRALADMEKKKSSNPPSDIRCYPLYKSDLKSGPMSNPAAVPFKWEQIPGKAKDGRNQQIKLLEQPPPAPKLPPGRMVTDEKITSAKLAKDFLGSRSQRVLDTTSIAGESSVYKNVGDIEENGSSHSEGEESTYLDALDTLSQSESFMNCGMSGVSRLHDPAVKSNGTSLDPRQTRDFMMVRFLPAAKAAASKTTHSVSRKQRSVKEQQIVISDKLAPRSHYTPTCIPQYLGYERAEEDEDEEEDDGGDEYDRTENLSTKLCGLLPQFCALNPIPGMKAQPPGSIPSARKLPKKHSDPCIYDQFEKAIRDAVCERRRLTITQRSEMRAGPSDLNDELEKLNLKSASLKSDELASLGSDSIVPYRSVSIQSLMSKGTGFLGIPEASKRSDATTTTMHASPSLTAEKTMYIDSAQNAKYQDSNTGLHSLRLSMKDDIETTLPLPLPKRPSESWLVRALPSMSSRRPLAKSYHSAKSLTLKPTPAEPKWEALVKSSSLHNNNLGLPGLMRISEE